MNITYDTVEDNLWVWQEDGFRLEMWDTYEVDSLGKNRLGYRFFDYEFDTTSELFQGEDYCPGFGTSIDGPDSVCGLLGFLSIGEQDTDETYFAAYSPDQLEWINTDRREALALIVYDAENPENEE